MTPPEDGKSIVLLTALTVAVGSEQAEAHREPYNDMQTALKALILACQSMLKDGAPYRYMRFELIEGVSKVVPADQVESLMEKGEVRIIGVTPKVRH